MAHFEQHPDAAIIVSFPGLGMLAGARVLAEIGDDRSRFTDARGLKAFAGSAPITRASGKKTVVLHRHIKNRRLAAVGPIWALSSLRASPGARRHSTPAAPPETGTTKPNDTCSTNSSASSTTACTPASSTTNTWRFHLLSAARLDF
jgi:hypothetical protein